MYNKFVRVFLFLLLFLCPLLVSAFECQYPQDLLRYVLFQTEAVMNDVALYLGWDVENKEGLQKASKEAVTHINELLKDLSSIGDESYKKIVEDEKDALLSLKNIYAKIAEEKISDKEIDDLFAKLEPKLMKMAKEIAQLDKKEFKSCPKLDLDEVILKSLPRDKKKVYQQVLSQLKEKKLKSAYKLLGDLINSMGDADITYCLRYRKIKIAFWLSVKNEYKGDTLPEEDMIALGKEVFNKGIYLPCLVEIFRSWRHCYQVMLGGVSNWSHIYNWKYNKVRFKVSKIIRNYLSNHPDNSIAYAQLCHLWLDTNILRGGRFGNSVLNSKFE